MVGFKMGSVTRHNAGISCSRDPGLGVSTQGSQGNIDRHTTWRIKDETTALDEDHAMRPLLNPRLTPTPGLPLHPRLTAAATRSPFFLGSL